MGEIEYLSRREHEEFARRMETENSRRDDEDKRQNHRIELLERNAEETRKLTVSVEKMATSMEQMVKEQAKQGQRLDEIEKEPGEKWKRATWEVLKYILVAVLALAAAKVGLI